VQTPLAFPPFDFTAALNSAALFLVETSNYCFYTGIFGFLPKIRLRLPVLLRCGRKNRSDFV